MRRDDSSLLPVPGPHWGEYPEVAEPDGGIDLALRRSRRRPGARADRRRLARVRAQCLAWRDLGDAALAALQPSLQLAIAQYGLQTDAAEHACAFVAETARRTLGKTAYDGQLLAALHMLDNRLVEMAAGEGKSLAVALAAAMGGLAGVPVHVLTANDYLVARDAQAFRPLFDRLGLGVATVVASHPVELRLLAYGHAVVYVTAREVALDYLRDRLQHGNGRSALQRRVGDLAGTPPRRLLRGLCMAIVDEADSILIDEAQTPLVLSRDAHDGVGRAFLWQAWALSGRLEAGTHFESRAGVAEVTLTDAGRTRIAELAAVLQPVWKNTQQRDDTIASALVARHLLQRDRDYVLGERAAPDGRRSATIRIVDPTTGRIAEGRQRSGGLHALIAIKENVRPEPEPEALARINFQRFFRRYHRLGGMSGTLHEARGEMAQVYGLATVRMMPRLPNQHEQWPTRCFATDAARWRAVVERTRRLVACGRPVLIGTDSVADSGLLVALLRSAGIEPALLNARFDRDEAQLVAQAGRAGQVTVSTHMAGRGTDIALDARALRHGGLHVICCQHNPSRRLDRQLCGRAGRQGQPGSAETWLSLEAVSAADGPWRRVLQALARALTRADEVRLPAPLPALGHAWLQRHIEARQRHARARLMRDERDVEQRLAFGAPR
jgi:preprotein translocase subunit SecA